MRDFYRRDSRNAVIAVDNSLIKLSSVQNLNFWQLCFVIDVSITVGCIKSERFGFGLGDFQASCQLVIVFIFVFAPLL